MFELIPSGLRIDFIGKTKGFVIGSLAVIVIGLVSIALHGGLKQGIDFSGGTLLHFGFGQDVELGVVRQALAPVGLEQSIVQHFGSSEEVLIRVAQSNEDMSYVATQLQEALQQKFPQQQVEVLRVEVVGPQVSADLRRKALFALFYAVLGIVIYLSGRFEAKWLISLALAGTIFIVTYPIMQWLPNISPTVLIVVALAVTTIFSLVLRLHYALAALVAVYHDVLVTVGLLSIFNREFDLQVVAALLTIIGYSLNDTIVIFDRVRENMRGRRWDDFPSVVNESLNQTLSRTILTSGLTLIVIVSLLALGGEVIRGFAFALLVGVIAGTFSTLFIASPLLVYWHQRAPRRQASGLAVGGTG